MSSIPSAPAGPRDGGRLPDDLDGRLRAFFRAEMPEPWPALEPPAPAAADPPAPRRWPLWRSRLALAASVACLMIGQLSLSGVLQDAAPYATGSAEGGVAGRDARLKPKLYKPNASPPQPAAEGDWLPGREKGRR